VVEKPPSPYAKFVLEEAKRGDPAPLIGRFRFFLQCGGEPLSDGEIQFIVEALEETAGKRSDRNLRKVEQALITMQVEHLMSKGKPLKAAIYEVMQHRGRSRRHVFKALAEYKKGKNRDG
jgi:hypothetical protein